MFVWNEALSDGHGIIHQIEDGTGGKTLSQHPEDQSKIQAPGKAIHSNKPIHQTS